MVISPLSAAPESISIKFDMQNNLFPYTLRFIPDCLEVATLLRIAYTIECIVSLELPPDAASPSRNNPQPCYLG